MDNNIRSVEDYVQSGVAERFYKVFGTPLLFYQGTDVKTVAVEYLKNKNYPEYPFARAKINTWAVSDQRYNARHLLRRGLYGQSTDDFVQTYNLKILPVTTTYDIEFYVQDKKTLTQIGKDWLMSSQRGSLKFAVVYGLAQLDISVHIEPSFQVPSREDGVSNIKEYIATAQMQVHGYMSEQIQRTQAVTQIEVELQIISEQGERGATFSLLSQPWATAIVESTLTQADTSLAKTTWTQNTLSTAWVVRHNLPGRPQVLVQDQSGQTLEGDVYYPDQGYILITFPERQMGKAYLF